MNKLNKPQESIVIHKLYKSAKSDNAGIASDEDEEKSAGKLR